MKGEGAPGARSTCRVSTPSAANSERMPSPTPSLPIFVRMAGARPSRAAAVNALPQLPPPCSGVRGGMGWKSQAGATCRQRLQAQRQAGRHLEPPDSSHACFLPTCASNFSVRSFSSGLGKAATWASRSWPLLPMPTTLIARGRGTLQPCSTDEKECSTGASVGRTGRWVVAGGRRHPALAPQCGGPPESRLQLLLLSFGGAPGGFAALHSKLRVRERPILRQTRALCADANLQVL